MTEKTTKPIPVKIVLKRTATACRATCRTYDTPLLVVPALNTCKNCSNHVNPVINLFSKKTSKLLLLQLKAK